MRFSLVVVLLLAVVFTANGQGSFDFGQIAQLAQGFQGGQEQGQQGGFDLSQVAQLAQGFQGGQQGGQEQGQQQGGQQGGFDLSQVAQLQGLVQGFQGGQQGGQQGGSFDLSQFTDIATQGAQIAQMGTEGVQGAQGGDVSGLTQALPLDISHITQLFQGGQLPDLNQFSQGGAAVVQQGQDQQGQQQQGGDAASQLATAQQVLGSVQQTGFGQRFGGVLTAANGILGLFGRAMTDDPVSLDDLTAVEAAAAMAEQELDFAMADFAAADVNNGNTGNTNSAPATPAWAIGLIVLGALVLVALVVVQVQLIALYRSRGARPADRV